MMPSRIVSLAVLILALSGCLGAQVQEIRSEADVLADPLPPEVTVGTLVSLVSFAVKDRRCLSVPEEPHPAMHSRLYAAYTGCVYESPANECDATVPDLRTMRTLMERDPRLRAIADFEMVVDRLNEECSVHGRKPFSSAVIRPWEAHQLQRCAGTPGRPAPEQPVLIVTAIGLRPPARLLKNLGDEFTEWSSLCAAAKGSIFLLGHCLDSGTMPYYNTATGKPAAPASYKKLGIENYYCRSK